MPRRCLALRELPVHRDGRFDPRSNQAEDLILSPSKDEVWALHSDAPSAAPPASAVMPSQPQANLVELLQ